MSTGDDDLHNWYPILTDQYWLERMVTEDKRAYLRHETAPTVRAVRMIHGTNCICKVCQLNKAFATLERTHPHLFKKGSRARATKRK